MVAKMKSKWKRHLRKKKGNKCQICGGKQSLNTGIKRMDQLNRLRLHHINTRSKGGNNHQKNLLLVCPSCEDKLHNRRQPRIK